MILNYTHTKLNGYSANTLQMNITINHVILAAKKIIYRNRHTGGTLVLAQVRHNTHDQVITDNVLPILSLNTNKTSIKAETLF